MVKNPAQQVDLSISFAHWHSRLVSIYLHCFADNAEIYHVNHNKYNFSENIHVQLTMY